MASGAIKGITIEFRGDTTKLGKALNDVNKEIRTTDSALREVDKALKLDPTNVELLAQKEALLNKQIEQTREKLELQEEAAKAAAQALEEGTITQEEYAKLAAQVATTAGKLDELEASASGASDELSETAQSAEEAGEATEDSGDKFEAWGEVISTVATGAVAAIAAITAAVAATAGALAEASIQTASLSDEILTMSQVTGVSTDTLQAMNYASELIDVSTETMTSSMTRLIRTMSSAQDGSQSAVEAFENIGVSITDADGNLRDSEAVFWDIIDALGTISNETERDAAAMELLGRGARELNPLILAGSDAFEELREEAEETGYIMSGDTLEAFGDLDDNMQRLRNGATAARNAIGGILLPILTDLSSEGVSLLSDFTNALLDTDGDIEQLGAVIDEMVPRVLEVINTYLPMLIELAFSILETLASALLANLPLILESGAQLLLSICQGIVDNLGNLGPVISELILMLVNFIITNLPTVINGAMQIVVAVVDGISRSLPELIPSAVACVEQIATALIDNIDLLLPAALELMLALALGLIAAIPDLLDCIPTIADALRNELTEIGPSIAEAALTWGADLIDNFISGITEGFNRLGSTLTSMAQLIDSYVGFSVPEKGPLHEWAYNNPGADMIDLFTQGMDDEEVTLQRALYGASNTIYNGLDYSSQLSGISAQLAGIGGGGMAQPINVYFGTQRVATVVANANAENNYRSGGL